jgi:hypothetical protein
MYYFLKKLNYKTKSHYKIGYDSKKRDKKYKKPKNCFQPITKKKYIIQYDWVFGNETT